ncbi:MAG: hypothetical protein N3J91_02470 [Verrucomicrobiae bacterium]|nr:hypothetical protein [Verrucomicrobiae bacterium]
MESDHIKLKWALPERLFELMNLGADAGYPWRDEELAAILQYQLNRALEEDLGPLPENARESMRQAEPGLGGGGQTFGFWLHHAHPPVELLRSIKQFAKASHGNPLSGLPPKVSLVLYYLSLAVALVRCKTRITSLSNEELKVGFDQLANASWVDPASRAIFEQAWLYLTGKGDIGQNPLLWPESYRP